MFGFGNKTYDVRLTEKQIREIEKNMSRRELKEFKKSQQRAENDLLWDLMMLAEIFDD